MCLVNSQTEEEKEAKKADQENLEAELKRLSEEQTVLAKESSRNERKQRKVQGWYGVTNEPAKEGAWTESFDTSLFQFT